MFSHFKSRAVKSFPICRETAPSKHKPATGNIIYFKLSFLMPEECLPFPT